MAKTSVIIPVYNDLKRLRLCLDALARQTVQTDEFEVLVIDNGSTESPAKIVSGYPFTKLVSEPKKGSYAARNTGLRIASGEMLAFTDADCIPCPGWIEHGISMLNSNPDCGIVGGKTTIFPANRSRPNGAELYDIAFGLPQEKYTRERGLVVTANLFTRRFVFDEVGLFDESAMSGGDHEWSGRVVAAGFQVLYSNAAEIRHPARASLSELLKQARRHVGGRMDLRRSAGKARNATGNRLRIAFRLLWPNFRRTLQAKHILKKEGYHSTIWLKAVPIVFLIQYAQALEYGSKLLGLNSERT